MVTNGKICWEVYMPRKNNLKNIKPASNPGVTKQQDKLPIRDVAALLKATGQFLAVALPAVGAFLFVLYQVGAFSKPASTPTPTLSVLTGTATLGVQTTDAPTLLSPTGTPETVAFASVTPSIQPTFTPLPVDCLSSQEWQFYPDAQVNQTSCLDLLPYFISYGDGQFDFSTQAFKAVNVYGISRQIPLKSTIEATYSVNELAGGGRLWLGVTSALDPQKESLMFVILPDRYITVRGISDGNSRDLVTRMPVPYFFDQPKKNYVIKIEMDRNRVDFFINGAHILSTVIDFSNRRLFIGYQSVRDVKLSVLASLHDLNVK
jgi:hypothetical protein